MKSLVGYTGFVGSNLMSQISFDQYFNSKNITDAFGTKPELLVYAGLRAEKFLANRNPDFDYANVLEAIENVKKINPKKIILISTIDVYKIPVDVDEDSTIETKGLHPYGLNRYKFELWIENNFKNYLIIHLPGLYGENIKKNFIYDLINPVPSMLAESKFLELFREDTLINKYYFEQDNGFYKLKEINRFEKDILKQYFKKVGFSSLNFTDSRGIFQFYNLAYLWNHIEIALNNGINKLNIATEPVSIDELFKYVKNTNFINKIMDKPPKYDFKTKHYKLFNGKNGYIYNKRYILEDIKRFVQKNES